MTTLTISARGPADPDTAWERYARPQLWPTWSPQIQDVVPPVDRIVAGWDGRVSGLLGTGATFHVDHVDEQAREWSWTVLPTVAGRVGPGVARLRLEHGVRPHDAGSLTWLRLHGSAPLVLGYAPFARLALARLVA